MLYFPYFVYWRYFRSVQSTRYRKWLRMASGRARFSGGISRRCRYHECNFKPGRIREVPDFVYDIVFC